MKYKDIKAVILEQVAERQNEGETQEQAESALLKACIDMCHEGKFGVLDLKYVLQILGYRPRGELYEEMEEAKAAIRKECQIDECIDENIKAGMSREQAIEAVVESACEGYRNGTIKEIEQLDMALWTVGYRLTEACLENGRGEDTESEESDVEIEYEEDVEE